MAINYDRGPNDLEEVIDKLKKQKKILQNRLKKLDRTEEIMALYAEVKRLKNLNEDLQRELHDRKTND
jgi:chaperonin cofactor prefoldin